MKLDMVGTPKAKVGPSNVKPTKPQGKSEQSGVNIQPARIVFLSGPLKGKAIDPGTGFQDSRSSQSANWSTQEGHGIRVGKTFKNIGSRQWQLTMEYYKPDGDVSRLVENVFHLQELDPETQEPPRLHYQEGATKVAPVICTSIAPEKDHPLPGGNGFHYAKVAITLELLGGRGSEHRLAKPLTETELSEYAQSVSRAQRERDGTVAAAKTALADCLTPGDAAAVESLLKDDKAGDAGRVGGLSDTALMQVVVAGLVPPAVVEQLGGRLDDALAQRLAATLPGVGKNNPVLGKAVASSIRGTPVPLPPDIQKEIPELQTDYQLINAALKTQKLGDNDPVMGRATASDRVRRVGACGLRLRQSNSAQILKQQSGGLPAELSKYFNAELGSEAANPQARDKHVLDKANDALSKDDAKKIRDRFKLKTNEQAEALKKGRPFKSKEDFAKAIDPKNTATGLTAWSAFTDDLAASKPGAPDGDGVNP
jgi:hypothetical protein